MGDQEHLARYVADDSEEAFQALVRQYAGMVLATALRRTGDRCAAEEISQNVFTILARKAGKLTAKGPLGGWLHRTTLLEARNYIQQQERRLRKMQALTELEQSQRIEQPPESEGLPEYLDEAIDRLPASYRRIILLRFFDGLSIREIAAVTGKSEAASQRQSHRALQKLSQLLRGRGAGVSVSVLAAQLVPQTSKAVTAEVVTSLSTAALSGAASVTNTQLLTNTILTMTYPKTVLTLAASVTAAVTIAIPVITLAQGEERRENSSQAEEWGAVRSHWQNLDQRTAREYREIISGLGLTGEKRAKFIRLTSRLHQSLGRETDDEREGLISRKEYGEQVAKLIGREKFAAIKGRLKAKQDKALEELEDNEEREDRDEERAADGDEGENRSDDPFGS